MKSKSATIVILKDDTKQGFDNTYWVSDCLDYIVEYSDGDEALRVNKDKVESIFCYKIEHADER
jgi:hypothetical protein